MHLGRNKWIVVGAVMTVALGASAQTRPPAKRSRPAGDPAVATVGGMSITRSAFEQRFRDAEEKFRSQSAGQLPAEFRPMVRRQVLESMIREHLMILEARRRGMTTSAAQAEAELKKDPFFQDATGFDEAKYLAIKASQPERFESAVAEIQRTLAGRRLKEQLDQQNRPDPKQLRTELERKFSEVTIEYLALRRASFTGDRPEPSEREVLEYYRNHAGDFRKPERTRLSLVMVNQPGQAPETGSHSVIQEWEASMRQRADSLLNVVRRGAQLEDVAQSFGGVRTEAVAHDAFPAFWRGNERQRRAVFSASPGTLLPEPVAGERGFMLVRVDEHIAAGPAPFRDVMETVRARARAAMSSSQEEQNLRALYGSVRDSLRGTAHRIRYAVADTAVLRVLEPSAADVDRYYRGHLADYSFFDSKSGTVGAKPLAEVQQEIRARLLQERRQTAARDAAAGVLAVWKAGKRDARAERAMTLIREVGPVPAGGAVDTGLAGQTLTDTLASRRGLHADMARFERGWIAYHVFAEVPDYAPTLEQVRPVLLRRLQPLREQEEEIGARQLYQQNPTRFAPSRTIRFSRLMVQPPELLSVSLTREEVERYYNTHLELFGAPELARVRHILITPREAGAEADAEARREAEDMLRRIKAGESFADLARKHSDDEATRQTGGDVGVFRRGVMLDEFENAAFAMEPGDVRGPIRTEVGYHVLESLEYVPAEVTPLKYCYSNAASGEAREKGMRIARFRADSLRRALRSPAQARALAERQGMLLFQNDHVIGTTIHVPELQGYFATLETTKPGQLTPGAQEYRGMGYAITWVDSVLAPRAPRWEEARDQALDLYRREGDKRRMLAKRAELDSLLRAGWSLDSVATLFGGLERHGPAGPGGALQRMSGKELLDSLAFGAEGKPPVLQVGKVSDWIEFPAGVAKLRLVERQPADPVQLASQFEKESRLVLERNLRAAFDRMKQRFPVEILDSELRITELPPLTGS